jgi:hypothetical protein
MNGGWKVKKRKLGRDGCNDCYYKRSTIVTNASLRLSLVDDETALETVACLTCPQVNIIDLL